jgi:hypothetical protein
MVMLNELTNIMKFSKDVINGYIRFGVNEDKHFLMLCYTSKTQFSGHWVKETTLLARGLAVRVDDESAVKIAEGKTDTLDDMVSILDTAQVIGRGMRKFFTVDAASNEWGKIKLVDDDENVTVDDNYTIDFDAPATVADKLDGALGIGIEVNGELVIGTKGSYSSDEALIGTRYLHDNHDADAFKNFLNQHLRGFSPLFEIISPEEDHVVKYGDFGDIVFLGLMNITTGRWNPAALLGKDGYTDGTGADTIADRFGFTTPDVYHADSLGSALSLPALDNHEGMVVTLETDEQNMFKIKYPMFLMLQRLKNLSKSGLVDVVRNMDVQDIINGAHVDITASIPDGYLESASSFIDDVVAQADDQYLNPIRSLVSSVEAIFEDISGDYDLTSREGIKGYVFRVQGMDIDRNQKSLLLRMKSLDDRSQRMLTCADIARNLVIKNNK